MAEYIPTAISAADDFSATVVSDNFDKLETVASATIGDYQYADGQNVRNSRKSLSYHSFHKASLTEVWKSGDLGGGECFVLIQKGSASTIAYNEWANKYDVASSGLTYYLREDAKSVSFASYVDLQKVKAVHPFSTLSPAATHVDYTIKASLVVDGSVVMIANCDFTSRGDDHRGKTPMVNHMVVAGNAAASKGVHAAHLRLDISMTMNTTPPAANTLTHFKGSGGSTIILATYK